MRLPVPAVVVLVGPSGSGKSTWAARHFRPEQIVSADRLRALVGEGEHDQRAGKDAFDVLGLILERRLRRRLLTVIDTLALDAAQRQRHVELARRHGLPCIAVVFDAEARVCRARNKTRARPVPDDVIGAQLRRWPEVRDGLGDEGFDAVHPVDTVELVPLALLDAPELAARQRSDPLTLDFGLHVNAFNWPDGSAATAARLAAIAVAAEDAGFTSLWVMDHLLQIPQVGREWDDLLEAYTTLGFLAGRTERIRLGVLVTAVTFRPLGVLANVVATLDVLSGGRAACGLGLGWFEREHRVAGVPFPSVAHRYARLEDALRVLPLYWGPGSPAFEGRTVTVPAAVCYPRPLQEHVPLLVGGSGERSTLRLVARHADACNLFGDAETVRHKISVLHQHCADAGRDPSQITVTQLSTVLIGRDRDGLAAAVDRLRPPSVSPETFAAAVNAGTTEDHIGRFRGLAEAGVHTAIVSLAGLDGPAPIERFAPVIEAFGGGDGSPGFTG